MSGIQKGFTLVVFLVLGVLALGAVATYSFMKKIDQVNPKASTNPTANQTSSPTPTHNYSGWKSYKSPRFNYEFKYPESWTFVPYDEKNPAILVGSHSLSNYPMEGIEKYMDHGIVDWEGFVGDKMTLKLDLSAQKMTASEQQEFINKTFGDAKKSNTSKLQFDNLETTEYVSVSETANAAVHSYVAYPSDSLIIFASVMTFNKTEINFSDPEWRDLEAIFASFTFEESE